MKPLIPVNHQRPREPYGVRPTVAVATRVQDEIDRYGEHVAAERIGLARITLFRVAGRIHVHRATLQLLEHYFSQQANA